jgi:hypothetical protein
MSTARHEIVKSTEYILAALPTVTEAWEQAHVEIAENTIQALLDNVAGLQTNTATVRRVRQIAKRAMVLDAKTAGDNS